ncbi:Uncharacterized protein BM_BM1303 [Brugia malayi]|uniref:Bm1303 n=1 Tax=Brugia malayi TaxID=6279 RepID=A0A0J9XUN6_BRUMA|nr:Uncharacterized protein BM_BM1303 [Brugia malayi]CDP95459.1 Bm1303 [Brugia malayi]VIO88054.1 Uncharacterized protein BM_BM1303 [Brugia malayi]
MHGGRSNCFIFAKTKFNMQSFYNAFTTAVI